MGCNSDYMEANYAEKNSKDTAEHLVYVYGKQGKTVPNHIQEAANNYYGNQDFLNEFVVELCDNITKMTKKEREAIVYNAHDKQARKLAQWWEEHQAADQQRIAKEELAKNDARLVKEVEAKLNPAQLAALKRALKAS